MSDSDLDIISFVVLMLIIYLIFSIIFYFYVMKTKKGIYGNYTNLDSKVIEIDSLPISFRAKAIDITFPGCIPKPGFNPVSSAPIICNNGIFSINGQINSDNGSFTGINANAGVFMVTPSNSNFDIKLSRGTDDDFNKIKKLY